MTELYNNLSKTQVFWLQEACFPFSRSTIFSGMRFSCFLCGLSCLPSVRSSALPFKMASRRRPLLDYAIALPGWLTLLEDGSPCDEKRLARKL
jgi:hypothetical protein